ncbi:MAG: YqgE/AlgH family protein [Acidobacteriota bacterium]|nr:YqgE/AlgH family protein [Acidobacteriota bacterium]
MLRAGRLLVANPLLPDPNFDRTVVLLLAHGEEGALGLVLNRPSQMEVGDPLPQWEHLAAEPAVLFLGGPVQHQAVICLARSDPGASRPGDPTPAAGTEAVTPPGDWKEVAPGIGTVDLDQDPGRVGDAVGEVRMFAGYAGWSAGQLEGEIDAGAWWVVDAETSDAFTLDPAELWKQVLRRQPYPLAFVSWYPDDPAHQ